MVGDIQPIWITIMGTLDQMQFMLYTVEFCSHNDGDILQLGNDGLCLEECRSHFCAMGCRQITTASGHGSGIAELRWVGYPPK